MEAHEDGKELDAGLRPLDHYKQVCYWAVSPLELC
jgi:hypothetical protein